MARRKFFDDSELQAALKVLEAEWPKQGMKGMEAAGKLFVRVAKKKTKLAREKKIRDDYVKSGIAIRQADGNKAKAEREIRARIRAIGYQREGWELVRVVIRGPKKYVEIHNTARNSRFVKNTQAALRFARREINKRLPDIVAKPLKPLAKKVSA